MIEELCIIKNITKYDIFVTVCINILRHIYKDCEFVRINDHAYKYESKLIGFALSHENIKKVSKYYNKLRISEKLEDCLILTQYDIPNKKNINYGNINKIIEIYKCKIELINKIKKNITINKYINKYLIKDNILFN